MGDVKITTEGANFLAKAFYIPKSILNRIFEETNSIDERNERIIRLAFAGYVLAETGHPPGEETTEEQFAGFLVTAVMRTYFKKEN